MGLFLRQLSATLIVATVLAVSLSASFAAMYVLGFTLNNLTPGGADHRRRLHRRRRHRGRGEHPPTPAGASKVEAALRARRRSALP